MRSHIFISIKTRPVSNRHPTTLKLSQTSFSLSNNDCKQIKTCEPQVYEQGLMFKFNKTPLELCSKDFTYKRLRHSIPSL
jgi:hypothetical protein